MIPPKTSVSLLASVGAIHSAETAAIGANDYHIHHFWRTMAFKNHMCAICPPSQPLDCFSGANTAGCFVWLEEIRTSCSTGTVTYTAHYDIEGFFFLLRVTSF